jgi:hypothetical protein
VEQGLHHPSDRLNEEDDYGQGIVDLVRDAGNDGPQGSELLGMRGCHPAIFRLAPLARPKLDAVEKRNVARKIEGVCNARVVRASRDCGKRVGFVCRDDAERGVAAGVTEAYDRLRRAIPGDDDFNGCTAAPMLIKAA